MFRKILKSKNLIGMLPITLISIAALSFTPMAHAYGPANWQATFAGTFVAPANGGSSGFWGWCDFAGGTTSGTESDCETSFYFGPSHSLQVVESTHGTTWDQELGQCGPPAPAGSCSPPGVVNTNFFIIGGSVSFGGPTAAQVSSNPSALHCAISGATLTCPRPDQTAACSLSTFICTGSGLGGTIPCQVSPAQVSPGESVSCITLNCAVEGIFVSGTHEQAVGCSVPGQETSCTASSGTLVCVTSGTTSEPFTCSTSGLALTCAVSAVTAICTVAGAIVTCPIQDAEWIGIYSPDTGVPTAAGQYKFTQFLRLFGVVGEFQATVTQIP